MTAYLTLFTQFCKMAITNAADTHCCAIIHKVGRKYGILFHVNQLLAEDSHEISKLILFFKEAKFENTFRFKTYNHKGLFDIGSVRQLNLEHLF